MKREQFRAGDLVEIVTVNRPSGEAFINRRSTVRQERWRAVVVGPSVVGPGWWMVKKLNERNHKGGSYTVPDIEMVRVER